VLGVGATDYELLWIFEKVSSALLSSVCVQRFATALVIACRSGRYRFVSQRLPPLLSLLVAAVATAICFCLFVFVCLFVCLFVSVYVC
jgi:hypothetical protein